MNSNTLELENKIKSLIKELEPLREIEGNKKFGIIHPEEGQFLQMLIAVSSAKNVLEIGTSIGISTLWMCRGLLETEGRITTIDYYSEHIRLAKENFKRAGVEGMVTIVEGDALNVIPLLSEKFDFVFSDANKEQNLAYFNLFMPLLENGGVVVAHDSILEAENMFDYLKTIENHPQLDTVITTTAHSSLGLAISYKK